MSHLEQIKALKTEYEREVNYLYLLIEHDKKYQSLHNFIPALIEAKSVYERIVKDLEELVK